MGTQPAAVAYSAPAGVRSSSFVPAVTAVGATSYGASPYGVRSASFVPAVTAVSATPTSYGQLPVATSMVASPYGQQAYGQQAMMVPATSMAVSPYGQQVPAGYGATPGYG